MFCKGGVGCFGFCLNYFEICYGIDYLKGM